MGARDGPDAGAPRPQGLPGARGAAMLLFCPGCGNGLIVEEGQRCHRFACNTCPYVHNITRKVITRRPPPSSRRPPRRGAPAAPPPPPAVSGAAWPHPAPVAASPAAARAASSEPWPDQARPVRWRG